MMVYYCDTLTEESYKDLENKVKDVAVLIMDLANAKWKSRMIQNRVNIKWSCNWGNYRSKVSTKHPFDNVLFQLTADIQKADGSVIQLSDGSVFEAWIDIITIFYRKKHDAYRIFVMGKEELLNTEEWADFCEDMEWFMNEIENHCIQAL